MNDKSKNEKDQFYIPLRARFSRQGDHDLKEKEKKIVCQHKKSLIMEIHKKYIHNTPGERRRRGRRKSRRRNIYRS